MSFLSYLIPRTVARYSSRYNRDIRVVLEYGRHKLLVNGTRYSGVYIEKLWSSAFRSFHITPSDAVQSALVLGVAGGDVIRILRRLYKNAHITGVDIDPVMITIGRTYFDLQALPRVTLVCKDAKQYVGEMAQKRKRFDVIIVDTFLGRHIPSFVSEEHFLNNLANLVYADGYVIINYLHELEYKQRSDVLLDKLQKIFHSVKERGIYKNRFFFVSHT